MSTLYDLVNVFNPEGKWLGEFINESVAKDWLHKHKMDLATHEISKRRPEWKREV